MEKELRRKLRKYSKIFIDAQEKGKKEADVVMYLVQFFQDTLGYNIFDEISKEYQIKGKYCDIALKINGEVCLLVEAKQPGIRLVKKHIEQAEMYGMRSGIKWVLLTNGCDWRLYHLSYDESEGIESTLVFQTDLVKSFQEKPADVAEKFMLLHKRNFLKGDLEKYYKKKTMLVPEELAKALFTEDVLRAIRKEVNRGAEVRVELEDITRALKNLLDKEVLADMVIKVKKSKRPVRKKPKTTQPTQIDYTGKKPEKAKLFKETFEVNNWRGLLLTVAEKLAESNPEDFHKLADSEIMKGQKQHLLTKNKSSLRAPHQLSNGLFLETNLSSYSIVRLIKNRLLKGCGYKETDIEIILKQ